MRYIEICELFLSVYINLFPDHKPDKTFKYHIVLQGPKEVLKLTFYADNDVVIN